MNVHEILFILAAKTFGKGETSFSECGEISYVNKSLFAGCIQECSKKLCSGKQ